MRPNGRGPGRVAGRVITHLVATLDPTTAADRLADLVVPGLADWCVVSLIDDGQHTGDRRALRNVGARHRDPGLQPVVDEYAQLRLGELSDHSLVDAALHDRAEPLQHVPGDATAVVAAMFAPGRARSLFELLAPEAAVVLPLDGPNGPVGILSLATTPSGATSPPTTWSPRDTSPRGRPGAGQRTSLPQQCDVAETLQRSL